MFGGVIFFGIIFITDCWNTVLVIPVMIGDGNAVFVSGCKIRVIILVISVVVGGWDVVVYSFISSGCDTVLISLVISVVVGG